MSFFFFLYNSTKDQCKESPFFPPNTSFIPSHPTTFQRTPVPNHNSQTSFSHRLSHPSPSKWVLQCNLGLSFHPFSAIHVLWRKIFGDLLSPQPDCTPSPTSTLYSLSLPSTMVEKSLMLRHLIIYFPRSSGMSERASK